MAIVQISKIQHRSGNIVDLPQLDEAEFGWASDAKRLFIGKTTPNENIEILTSYSQINFSQISGAIGNLNISNINIDNGQVLAFDGNNWVNKGGVAGGLITLGDVSNVKLTGGAIGYVLETDGTGNLSWTPKSTIVAYIKNIELGNGTSGNYTLVTTDADNAFGQGAAVTITGVIGTTELNGGTYYVGIQTANSFALFTDANLTVGLDSTGYGVFPYTTVSETSTITDQITVADATYFTIGDPVVFAGNLGNSILSENKVYYIKNKDTSAPNTWITISETVGGDTIDPGTATGLTGEVYAYGGRLISSVGSGSGAGIPGGSNTSIQFNRIGTFGGSADFSYNDTTKQFTVNGNANVGNLNATGIVLASSFKSTENTGTPPFQVNSTTQVANLNAATAGTVINNAQPNITSVGALTSLSVTGNLAALSNVSFTGGNVSLGEISNVHIAGGNNGFLIVTDGTGNLSFAAPTSVGPIIAGSNSQVQYNDGGILGASGNFTFNKTTNVLNVFGEVSANTLTSTVSTGTAPLTVNSTTQVANLNAATAGTVIDNAQPNITSLGTLTGLLVSGTASATTGSFGSINGNGAGLTNIPGANVTGKVANAIYADNAGNAGSVAWTSVSGRPTNVSQFTNDAGYITAAQVGGFDPGTRMMFAQSTAPTGWTKDTSASLNDSALRIVTGSAGSGGSVNFSSAFTNQSVSGSVGGTSVSGSVGDTSVSGSVGSTTVTGTVDSTAVSGSVGTTQVAGAVGSTTVDGTIGSTTVDGAISTNTTGVSLIITNTELIENEQNQFAVYRYAINDPGHSHTLTGTTHSHGFTSTAHTHSFSSPGHTHSFASPSHGHGFTSTAHSHTFTSPNHSHTFSSPSHGHSFTGSSINLAVKYVDVIIATKN